MRKPNYGMERKDRERAKQAKAAAKLDKRETRTGEVRTDTNAEGQEVPAADRPTTDAKG